MKMTAVEAIKKLIVEKPANVIAALKVPYVLVVKSTNGVNVVYQNRKVQNNTEIGHGLFGANSGIRTIFDIENSPSKHTLAVEVHNHDDEGKIVKKEYFTFGDNGTQEEATVTLFAYEAEKGKAVYCINIIEETGEKPIFTTAFRFGKNSEKLLKTQLRMYLALAGVNGEIREKIIAGDGSLLAYSDYERLGD